MDVVFACITAVLFGALTVAIRLGLRHSSPQAGAAAVSVGAFLVAGLITAFVFPFQEVGELGGLWRFVVAGAIAPGAAQIVYTWSVRTAGASRTGILIGAAPVISALLAIAFLDEAFEIALVVGTVAIVLGTAALVGERDRAARVRLIGTVFGVLTATFFAISAVLVRWASTETEIAPLVAATVTLAAGAAVNVVAMLPLYARSGQSLSDHVHGIVGAARAYYPAGALFGLAYITLLEAYERGPVTVVSPLTATESLFAVLFAALLLGAQADAINRRVLAAGALVVGGGVIVGVAA